MDFIFMLTRHDRTVADCLDVAAQIRPLGLRHVGFKDVGVEIAVLHALSRALKEQGATVYMEVVSTSDAACLALGAQRGRARGRLPARRHRGRGNAGDPRRHRDRLFPVPRPPARPPDPARRRRRGGGRGLPPVPRRRLRRGRPARLPRHRGAPVELVRGARAGLGDGRLIVAGSIDGRARLAEIAAAGADAFTVGSAVFDGSWAPHAGTLEAQLRAVLADRDAAVEVA